MAPSIAMAKSGGDESANQAEGKPQGAALGSGKVPGKDRHRRLSRDPGLLHAADFVEEPAVDRGHLEARQETTRDDGGDGRQAQGDERPRYAPAHPVPDGQDQQRECSDGEVGQAQRGQGRRERRRSR